MPPSIHFFPDTNLFAQCKPLAELDWSQWGVAVIDLIVCRPIQAEIDSHKGKGSGRLAKRARTASTLFRQALTADSGFIEIRAGNPTVRLSVRSDLKVDQSLDDILSYDERDHQLVGTSALYKRQNPQVDVRVLTHDTGPMGAARAAGVAFTPIPDDWLLAPELDETEKRTRILEAELADYRKAEPKFEAHPKLSTASGSTGAATIELPRYRPLEAVEIERLVELLKNRIPCAKDFGPREPKEVAASGFETVIFMKKTFTPASDESIQRYEDERYPNWVEACSTYLAGLHKILNAQVSLPLLTVQIRNTGSRPAEDALIKFTCKGMFQITAVPLERRSELPERPALPLAPNPPSGLWKTHRFSDLINGEFGRLAHQLNSSPVWREEFPSPFVNRGRDANSFYWHPERPKQPQSEASLTCQQWRHLVDAHPFSLMLHLRGGGEPVEGAILVEVHAKNLTKAFTQQFPVRVQPMDMDPWPEALKLIEQATISKISLS